MNPLANSTRAIIFFEGPQLSWVTGQTLCIRICHNLCRITPNQMSLSVPKGRCFCSSSRRWFVDSLGAKLGYAAHIRPPPLNFADARFLHSFFAICIFPFSPMYCSGAGCTCWSENYPRLYQPFCVPQSRLAASPIFVWHYTSRHRYHRKSSVRRASRCVAFLLVVSGMGLDLFLNIFKFPAWHRHGR